ncbi:zinc-dependent alcohol dehydrogenase family protein [Billgrantia sp. Q4P2]|uniref:zinc-dependent alcohol dehydrogenase family protein n=1 Tax=Billgrantia sp. Q4P2 TaxID=3463857 RepID=UPI004055A746
MPINMQRWELTRYGRDHLAQVDAVVPTPQKNEILVRVSAVALNYRDKLMVENGMGMALDAPLVPASDMAGEVVGLGPDATRFQLGDRVLSTFFPGWHEGAYHPAYAPLGGPRPGMLAEYVVLDQEWAVSAPRSLDAIQASTLPCAALTAWFALVENGKLHAGQTVVVQGTGGVALFGLQFARAHGARVIVTSGSDNKLSRALSLGATHGINRHAMPAWGTQVQVLTGGSGADHVLELVGGNNLAQSLEALAQGGFISQIGILEGFEMTAPVGPMLQKRATLQGIGVGHRRAFEDMNAAIDHLGIEPVIDSVFAFSDLPMALERLDRGPFGKVVVRVSD